MLSVGSGKEHRRPHDCRCTRPLSWLEAQHARHHVAKAATECGGDTSDQRTNLRLGLRGAVRPVTGDELYSDNAERPDVHCRSGAVGESLGAHVGNRPRAAACTRGVDTAREAGVAEFNC
eukprot:2860675-Prymnesium_polylepis.2